MDQTKVRGLKLPPFTAPVGYFSTIKFNTPSRR
jgi:hypothetical protein